MKWVTYAPLAGGRALLAGCSTPEPESTTNTTPPPQASASPPAEAPAAGTPAEKPAESTGTPPTAPAKVDPAKYKKLDGGLKYAILKPGTGPEAKAGQTVKMQYTGWLTDGKMFDSSYKHGGDPFTFPLGGGQVIPGWDKGIPGMKVGEKRQLVIPGD